MRAIEFLTSVTASAATSVAKPGNPPGADSMEAVLQVLLTMASKNPKINSKLQGVLLHATHWKSEKSHRATRLD